MWTVLLWSTSHITLWLRFTFFSDVKGHYADLLVMWLLYSRQKSGTCIIWLVLCTVLSVGGCSILYNVLILQLPQNFHFKIYSRDRHKETLNRGKHYIKEKLLFASDYIQTWTKYDRHRIHVSQSCLNILRCKSQIVKQQGSDRVYIILYRMWATNNKTRATTHHDRPGVTEVGVHVHDTVIKYSCVVLGHFLNENVTSESDDMWHTCVTISRTDWLHKSS